MKKQSNLEKLRNCAVSSAWRVTALVLFQSERLRKLTHKDIPWKWNHVLPFEMLKKYNLAKQQQKTYFPQNEATELIVDTSPVGLAAVHTQKISAIAYASRALTAVKVKPRGRH